MSMGKRHFSKEFKVQILTQAQAGVKISQLAKQHGLASTQIYTWQKQYRRYGDIAFAGHGNIYTEEATIAELQRKVGQLTMENELLKKANKLLMSTVQPNARGSVKS